MSELCHYCSGDPADGIGYHAYDCPVMVKATTIVWVNNNTRGNRYHTRIGCYTTHLAARRGITLEDAQNLRLRACTICAVA